jgi:hypothetical protein
MQREWCSVQHARERIGNAHTVFGGKARRKETTKETKTSGRIK